jgi:ribosome biogenesis GTPase
MSDSLLPLGWNEFFAAQIREVPPGTIPARVLVQQRTNFIVAAHDGEYRATVTGRLRFLSGQQADLPVVGDWVMLRPIPTERAGSITAVLQRKTAFSRRAPGREEIEQVIAANIDVLFLVTGLDENYNLRRIERYLGPAIRSGAQPVIVLNKTDLCPFVDEAIQEVRAVVGTAPIHATNSRLKTSTNCGPTWVAV